MPWRSYARDGQLSLTPTGDVTRVAHAGNSSWEVARRDGRIAVRPGEAFRLACSLGSIRKTDKAGVLLAATLFSTNGQALSWRYGCVRAQPDGTTESTFAVPEGGAALVPRIFGQHDADFDLKDLTLERTGTVPRAADLPDVAALRTEALDLEIQTTTLALAVTDRRTGRTWRTTTGNRAYPRFLVRKFTASAHALRFGVTDAETGTPLALVFATDPTASAEFTVTLAGRGLLKDRLPFPDPFAGAPGDHMILPLSEGFRLPMHERTFVGAIASLPDVLVGRYDCYRDIYPPELVRQLGWPPDGDDICRNTAAWPDGAIWNSADANDLRRAWGVTCPDGQKRFCVAQCTRCQPARVREHVARELKAKPFTARFIDVTTAVGAEECANPAHPATRTQSRQAQRPCTFSTIGCGQSEKIGSLKAIA